MTLPKLHENLERHLGTDAYTEDLPFWNSVIDQVGEGPGAETLCYGLMKKHVASITTRLPPSRVLH
jgi:hypothetical protein